MAPGTCPRCTRPAGSGTACGWCEPATVGLVASAAPWADEPAWPRAQRWLDDVVPHRDRRPMVVAMACVILAALLMMMALG